MKLVFGHTEKAPRLVVLLLWILGSAVWAQPSPQILTQQDVFDAIEKYHPVAKQAALLPARAQATLRMARGGFDPKISGGYEIKSFADKRYYEMLNGELKVPLRFGADLKAGYEANSGKMLSDMEYTPPGGLGLVGITMPLAQGLLIDQRRTTLQQARIYAQSVEAQQVSILNDIYFDAAKAYWEWVLAYNSLKIVENALRIAEFRLQGVKQMYLVGDEPAIDTVEALIQVQSRQASFIDAQMDYQKATYTLSNFLWSEKGEPLQLTDNALPPQLNMLPKPTGIAPQQWVSYVDSLAAVHPELRQLRYKLADLEVERRWKAEKLKPKINASYNLLSQQYSFGDAPYAFAPDNYKFGISISMPLYLREERGNLELARIKIQEMEYKRAQKELELRNKVNAYFAETDNLHKELQWYEGAVKNYLIMVRAEEEKFQVGESTLFLINSRELKLIEAQLKFAELQTKYQKALAGFSWAAGRLYE